jgi:hypothetical protein
MALVTDFLEKLIWKGKASYKTTTLGMGGYSMLVLPKNSIAVILDFTYWYFTEATTQEGFIENIGQWFQIMQSSIHQIRFESKRSSNQYVIRNEQCLYKLGQGASEVDLICNNGFIRYDTYMIHEDKIRMEIVRSPDIVDLTINSAIAPAECGYKDVPAGYGTEATPTALQQIYELTMVINPLAILTGWYNADFVPLALKQANTVYFDRIQFPYVTGTDLRIDPFGVFDERFLWRLIPIVNISYVIIDELPQNIRGF